MSILAMYIQGDIYPNGTNDPNAVVAAITSSKLTTPILGLCHVNCSASTCPNSGSPIDSHDADLTFNDTLIVRDGQYIGNPDWPATVKSLRAGHVTKIFASFGGYGVPDFSRIGKLMDKYGTGPDSPLYQNFACLKQELGLDGIDFDDEDCYDQNIVVKFAGMLIDMGFEITFCPYTEQDFWSGCVQALGASKISWINLQCYAGGKTNNPGEWTGMGVPVVAGVCADCCCEQTTCSPDDVRDVFRLWTTGQGSVNSSCWIGSAGSSINLLGGFIWTYGEVAAELDQYVDAMAGSFENPAISLPKDQYAHQGAPTEWWWHVGTLTSADGRKFGFEINATGMTEYGFTQIEITDVARQANYQQVTPIVPLPTNWAEPDPAQPWRVNLGDIAAKQGAITMRAIGNNPLNMDVCAEFVDATTLQPCKISLQLRQQEGPEEIVPPVIRPPLLVWGTACQEVDPGATMPLARNNYYYSLTRLNASGNLDINGEVIPVTGLTWMDHEYGAFPQAKPGAPVIWMLQDMQLDNGVHLSNFTKFGILPQEGVPMSSTVTVLGADGTSTYVNSVTTPLAPLYVSKKGITYYTNFLVAINSPEFPATEFKVTSLMPAQVFISPGSGPDVYEGVAGCEGTFKGQAVSGSAWIEQNLG